MTEKDYDFIMSTLRELTLYVYECKQKETSNEDGKALNKRLFNFPIPPDERERSARENIFSAPSPRTVAPMRHVVDSQQNRKQPGIKEIFTKKEIIEMPKLKDFSYRYKEEKRVHEFRYRRNGINKSFSSRSLKEARRKALEFCGELSAHESLICNTDVNFIAFAEDYLQNVKRKNVGHKTFLNDYNRYQNYIVPKFRHLKLKEVKAPFIQRFLNDVLDDGHKRTAEALYYILKTILDYGVNNDLITKNPIAAVKIPLHERETGQALPLSKEREFVKKIAGTTYELTFITLLYAGCRPCELPTLKIERDGFFTFQNMKQKKRNVIVYKDIPITPMLEPYVERIKAELPLKNTTELTKIFAKFVTGYRLYDLRHTFATRCQECGVPQEIVARWLGHKSDRITDNTYTHFPPKFMLEQAKKVDY